MRTSGHSRFFTSLDYRDHPGWRERADVVSPALPRRPGLLEEFFYAWRLLRGCLGSSTVLLQSQTSRSQPDLLVAALLSLLPVRVRPVVVLMGAMWQQDAGWRGSLQRLLVRRADKVVTLYAVQSTEELELFPRVWAVSREKVRLSLYYATTHSAEPGPPLEQCVHVVSGGDSHRDYDTLLEVARRLPERRFVLATRLLDGRADLPANVAAGAVDPVDYDELLRTSAAVVIPLRAGLTRAAGQQTYLNAMLFERPTVVADSPGVRDHIRHGVTGLVVDGSADGYLEALRAVLDAERLDQTRTMCRRAAADVRERFSFPAHAQRLMQLVDEAVRVAREPQRARR